MQVKIFAIFDGNLQLRSHWGGQIGHVSYILQPR